MRLRSAVLVFCTMLTLGMVFGHADYFQDPGTFWHLRLGQDILRTKAVPSVDDLTTSKQGVRWVDQSWLFDVAVAWLYGRGGWAALAWFVSLTLATIYAALAWWIEARTGRWTAAVCAALCAAALGAIHFLARPHLFTFAGFLCCLSACWAFKERGSKWVWSLPLVEVLWANLHGGFVLGPFVVVTAALATIVERPRDRVALRRAGVLLSVAVICTCAALVGPYGVGLYQHVWGLLVSARVTDLIQEYQPVRVFGILLRGPLAYLLLLLFAGLVWWATRLGFASRYDAVHALVWLHLGLSSRRNMPFFGLALAPVLGSLLTAFFLSREDRSKETESERGVGRVKVAAAVAIALGFAVCVVFGLRAGPSLRKWPYAGLRALDTQPSATSLFHEQDWGGFIEFASEARRQAWIDDRFELWGRAGTLDYLDARAGGPTWDRIGGEFKLVWVRPTTGLARALQSDERWLIVHRDNLSVLYLRQGERDTINAQ